MCKDVYVFAEQRDGNLQKVGIELIGEARKLADDLGQNVVAVLLGNQIKDKASELIAHGADKSFSPIIQRLFSMEQHRSDEILHQEFLQESTQD